MAGLLCGTGDPRLAALHAGAPGAKPARLDLPGRQLATHVVHSARLPANVVGMNSTVRYSELPDGEIRTIVVVHPANANAQTARFSVLSPVGRALLGRKTGSVVPVQLPSGNAMRVKILVG